MPMHGLVLGVHHAVQAKEQLALLEQAKEKRLEALTAEAYSGRGSGAPRLVDIRVGGNKVLVSRIGSSCR